MKLKGFYYVMLEVCIPRNNRDEVEKIGAGIITPMRRFSVDILSLICCMNYFYNVIYML